MKELGDFLQKVGFEKQEAVFASPLPSPEIHGRDTLEQGLNQNDDPGAHHVPCYCLVSVLNLRLVPRWELQVPVTRRTLALLVSCPGFPFSKQQPDAACLLGIPNILLSLSSSWKGWQSFIEDPSSICLSPEGGRLEEMKGEKYKIWGQKYRKSQDITQREADLVTPRLSLKGKIIYKFTHEGQFC